MPRVNVTRNDLEALKAAYAGVKATAEKVLQMESAVTALEPSPASADAEGTASTPPADLIRAATAHAIAAGAFSGLLHRLFTPGGVAPTPAGELTDSAGESA
jgi:hypothetical protein